MMWNMVQRNLFAFALLVLGCLQMAGYIVDKPVLRGVGAASAAALTRLVDEVAGLLGSHVVMPHVAD